MPALTIAPADPPRLLLSLVQAPLSQLLQPLKDIRDRSTEEYRDFFDRLVADLKVRHMQIPILAYKEGERLRIIDGLTRYFAALLALLDTVPVLLYEEKPNDSALLLGQLQCNAMRQDMTDLEYAAVYQQLMKLNGWCAAELWRQIKVNPAKGTKRLAISTKLCEQVRAWVADGSLAARPAYAISRLEDVPTQIDLAEKYRKQVLCAEGIESEVSRILSGGKRSKDQKPVTYKVDAIELITRRDTSLEILATALEKLTAVVRKLLKERKGIEYLALELKTA